MHNNYSEQGMNKENYPHYYNLLPSLNSWWWLYLKQEIQVHQLSLLIAEVIVRLFPTGDGVLKDVVALMQVHNDQAHSKHVRLVCHIRLHHTKLQLRSFWVPVIVETCCY